MVWRDYANRAVRLMTLPRRFGAATEDTWARYVALARQSRTASELLGSLLGRRIIVYLLRHHEFTPRIPLERLRMRDPEPVAGEEHLLIDGAPPHRTLGVTSALVVPGRLPAGVRWTPEHRAYPLCQLLDASGAFWTSETLEMEELTVGAASFPADNPPDTRMLRLTRRLSLIGTPVAIVLDEIPQPQPPADPAQDAEVPLARQ